MQGEIPSHEVTVDGFFIGATEVTNEQFEAFVTSTSHVTVA
ncbi:SUMF1/EgtB/PvdO family nonheme iron enzyme [Arenibacter palladensis]